MDNTNSIPTTRVIELDEGLRLIDRGLDKLFLMINQYDDEKINHQKKKKKFFFT